MITLGEAIAGRQGACVNGHLYLKSGDLDQKDRPINPEKWKHYRGSVNRFAIKYVMKPENLGVVKMYDTPESAGGYPFEMMVDAYGGIIHSTAIEVTSLHPRFAIQSRPYLIPGELAQSYFERPLPTPKSRADPTARKAPKIPRAITKKYMTNFIFDDDLIPTADPNILKPHMTFASGMMVVTGYYFADRPQAEVPALSVYDGSWDGHVYQMGKHVYASGRESAEAIYRMILGDKPAIPFETWISAPRILDALFLY